ncbi:hypothetical protein [Roseisalinus antarcticus]|uniref:hypothetical protein n=1 Tax=Roseisalinus antarcticus TaxID=254357 RepID=UPI00135663D5|nr:hypothetical protein [Roseisalinus antarcticus]
MTGQIYLVVGNSQRWLSRQPDLPALEGFHFCGFDELDPPLLTRCAPQIVLSPLFGDGFDALDLALRLQTLAFSGLYRAIAENLPNVAIVRREISLAAPDIDFDILETRTLLQG